MYLVEGLADGRVAIVTKTHEAMVGEHGGIDIAQVILDAAPEPRRTVEALWMPGPEPSCGRPGARRGARRGPPPARRSPTPRAPPPATSRHRRAPATSSPAAVLSPRPRGAAAAPAVAAARDAQRAAPARRRAHRARRLPRGCATRSAARSTTSSSPSSPARCAAGCCPRAEPLRPAATVRALVPVQRDRRRRTAPHGRRRAPPARPTVRPLLVDLPVGEPDPVLRLAQLRYAMAVAQGVRSRGRRRRSPR